MPDRRSRNTVHAPHRAHKGETCSLQDNSATLLELSKNTRGDDLGSPADVTAYHKARFGDNYPAIAPCAGIGSC